MFEFKASYIFFQIKAIQLLTWFGLLLQGYRDGGAAHAGKEGDDKAPGMANSILFSTFHHQQAQQRVDPPGKTAAFRPWLSGH